jgi:hypothetical protein
MGVTLEREKEYYKDDSFLGEYTAQYDSRTTLGADFSNAYRVVLENSPRLNKNHVQHHGLHLQDQFVISSKLTANLGIRWDYYHVYYPEQEIIGTFRDFFYAGAPIGPNNYRIAATYPDFKIPANENVLTLSGFGPRFGVAYDLAGNGKTVLKANWGRYKNNPGPQNFINPLQRISYTFAWNDLNLDRQFTLNEIGNFVGSTGGSSNTISPDLEQEYTDDIAFFVERELIANLGVRAGYVKKIGKNAWQEVQQDRVYSGYSDRRLFPDPGPDGISGNADDGPQIVAFDYPAGVTIPPSRWVLSNQPLIESWDQNLEVAITKRMSNRWSLLGGFGYNWDHAKGAPQNPNQERFNENDTTGWGFKFFSTYQAPWQVTINPVLRYQAGENLERTVQVTLRTGTLDYEAEREGAYRSDNVPIFDISAEKRIRLPGNRSLDAFVAAFNAFNSNAATGRDEIVGRRTATVNGQSVPYARFLRPTAILQPRVFRIGVKLLF